MKKILLIVCLALVCQSSMAQDDIDDKKKMEEMFGISLGLTYANIVGKHEDNSGAWGGQAGLYLALLKAKTYMITTYLLYSMMGAELSGIYDYKYRLNYLVMPFLFQYMLASNLYLGAGLQPGILLSAKQKYNDQSVDIKDGFKTFDLGVPILLSYYLAKSLTVSIGATPGITKINENGTGSARNFVGNLRLTYRF